MTTAATASPTEIAPGTLIRRTWRVPRENGSALIAPAWEELSSIIPHNQQRFAAASAIDVQGKSLSTLRQQAQDEALQTAIEYTTSVLQLPPPPGSMNGPLIVGGHQPELFHTGVWAKNFAVARLAQHTSGVPLQLIVDQDTLNSTSIKIPVGTRDTPALTSIDFDGPHLRSPWEEAAIADADIFKSVGRRVTEGLASWGYRPLIADVWLTAVQQARCTGRLVDAFTAVRAATERRWGAGTLELPMSRWWTQPAPLWFMAHLLAHHRRLAGIYNSVVREYRIANRVRSRAHPVPDLAQQDDWFEAPFWIWQAGDPRRDRLFVRQVGAELQLRDSRRTVGALPLDESRSATDAVAVLQQWTQQGWRLRTRALTTTWAARMLLADVFIHGLGGAKYDEMTDALIGRFWGCLPPEFATVSATIHLPLGEPFPETMKTVGARRHDLSDALHNPERHWDGAWPDAVLSLVAEKQRWLATTNSMDPSLTTRQRRAENHRRDQRLREIRRQLGQLAEPVLRRLHGELDIAMARLAANRVLQRREFSWVLYPEAELRAMIDKLFPMK